LYHRRDRQIALPRKAAVVSAQIHLDSGSIGGLNEDDPLRRNLPDIVDRQPRGDDLEAERASQPAHVLRRPVEIGQIVLEDLASW
jgi:hypothetical protein